MDRGKTTKWLLYDWQLKQDSDGNTEINRDYSIKMKAATAGG